MNNHTFVICAYKASPYLEACIRSLQAQQEKSIIIMYTSTPNELISFLSEKYNIPLYIGQGGSIGADWNAALSFVKTKYATIAHQDDVYFPEYSKKIIRKMEQSNNSIIGFSDYVEIVNDHIAPRNNNLKIKRIMLQPIRAGKSIRQLRRLSLAFGNAICCPSVTYNLDKTKTFQFSTEMRTNLDWDAWERLSLLEGSFCFVSEKLMGHRIHEASETTNCIEDQSRSKEDLMLFERFWPKSIATFLMKFYVKSQNSNAV